ncbi:MAG: hypothetical protein ACE5HS_03780 [bacterium]
MTLEIKQPAHSKLAAGLSAFARIAGRIETSVFTKPAFSDYQILSPVAAIFPLMEKVFLVFY